MAPRRGGSGGAALQAKEELKAVLLADSFAQVQWNVKTWKHTEKCLFNLLAHLFIDPSLSCVQLDIVAHALTCDGDLLWQFSLYLVHACCIQTSVLIILLWLPFNARSSHNAWLGNGRIHFLVLDPCPVVLYSLCTVSPWLLTIQHIKKFLRLMKKRGNGWLRAGNHLRLTIYAFWQTTLMLLPNKYS